MPAGEVFASFAINHIADRETLNKFSKWYRDTALEELTCITPDKLNSSNLGAVMKTSSKICPEGIVDVCIELFNKIKHLETESNSFFSLIPLIPRIFKRFFIETVYILFQHLCAEPQKQSDRDP